MRDFEINVNLKTKGVTQRGFGTILVLCDDVDLDLISISDIENLTIDEDSKTYKLIEKLFMQNPKPSKVLAIGGLDTPITELLNTTLEKTKDFFFVVTTSTDLEEITQLADKIESMEKMLFVTLDDVTNIKTLADKKYMNTFCHFHDDRESYYTEALTVIMSHKVGGKTVKFKQVNGVEVAEITELELYELEKINSGSYIEQLGEPQVSEGKVLSGEWLDVVLGMYFIKFKTEEEIMALALREDKIPYTNRGVGMLAGVVSNVMNLGITQGILNDFKVDYRKVENVPTNDKANRVYNFLTATGQLQGAIHGGEININLNYDEVIE